MSELALLGGKKAVTMQAPEELFKWPIVTKEDEDAVLEAFLSSVFAGIAYFCVGALKGKEDPQVIVFVFSAFTTVMTALFTLFDFVVPSAMDALNRVRWTVRSG